MRRFVLITHKEGNNSVDLIGQMKQLNSISRAPLLPPSSSYFLAVLTVVWCWHHHLPLNNEHLNASPHLFHWFRTHTHTHVCVCQCPTCFCPMTGWPYFHYTLPQLFSQFLPVISKLLLLLPSLIFFEAVKAMDVAGKHTIGTLSVTWSSLSRLLCALESIYIIYKTKKM